MQKQGGNNVDNTYNLNELAIYVTKTRDYWDEDNILLDYYSETDLINSGKDLQFTINTNNWGTTKYDPDNIDLSSTLQGKQLINNVEIMTWSSFLCRSALENSNEHYFEIFGHF